MQKEKTNKKNNKTLIKSKLSSIKLVFFKATQE